MELTFTPEEEAFRTEVQSFLKQHLPERLSSQIRDGLQLSKADMEEWHAILNRQGWLANHWPQQYGGPGWSAVQKFIFELECALAHTPRIVPFGVGMLGPVLIKYGNEAQKRYWLPRILSGEDWWCQGYSEPGAGSDLAGVKTTAVRQGDHYIVNGQKTWTSGGQWADWCFALVRTDKSKKHEGITFLLIDMKSPGVSVKPIQMISGMSPFCETFFDNVKVPKENRVGEEGQGWTIGKRLLQHERTNISGGGGRMAAAMAQGLVATAKEALGTDAQGRIADPELRARIAKFEMDWRTFLLTTQRITQESKAAGGVSEVSSILKTVGTKLVQERSELLIEISGLQGLGWEGEGFSDAELAATRGWLAGKATTIYGGSTEIQNNVIAKRILGMLDHQ